MLLTFIAVFFKLCSFKLCSHKFILERVFKMTAKKKIAVIHGPNLNLLGLRETSIYGQETLDEINETLKRYADSKNVELTVFQSNSEGDILDELHKANEEAFGVVINPAAYSHTSVAIRDAISAIIPPVVEVHLSNIYSREEFRQKSLTASVCTGVVTGFGSYSYILGIKALIQ